MFRTWIARFRTKRVSSSRPETPTYLQTTSIEQIWNSWRYEKSAPKSVDAAEQVKQLKRSGQYEKALRVALAEIRREEDQGTPTTRSPGITGKRLRSIGSSSDTMKKSP